MVFHLVFHFFQQIWNKDVELFEFPVVRMSSFLVTSKWIWNQKTARQKLPLTIIYLALVWNINLNELHSYQHKVPILQNFYLNTVHENYEEKTNK